MAQPPDGRCARHPSHLPTGVCSSCLMERLSAVGTPADQPEIVEVADAGPGPGQRAEHEDGKLRRPLLVLFQLDDSTGGAHRCEAGDPRLARFHADPGGGNRAAKWKGRSWFKSILSRKGMRWWKDGAPAKESSRPPHEGSVVDRRSGGGDERVERRPSFRRSCEWMACREPGRGSVEPPRHSWDGSMVTKALACSFTCLEEPPDGVRRTRRGNAEAGAGENRAAAAESRANGGEPSGDKGGEGRHCRGRSCDDSQPELAVSGIGRRRSNRWSKVWDRSITSPLKDFVRKGEHVLERSLSEPRKDSRRGKRGETLDTDGEVRSARSGYGSSRASQGVTRSSHAVANGDVHNFRPDWLRNKECKISRSRSVHYTSPGNLDNGLLRFYLTPMRSSRSTNRGRRKNSRMFARGIFGFI